MPLKLFPGEGFRKVAELSSLALMLPSSIAVGLFFGYFLDKWLGTHPWLLLIFLLLGIASGLMSLLRGLSKYGGPDSIEQPEGTETDVPENRPAD